MDSLILAEAIATVMGYEEKELCKPGRLALAVMLGTASTVLGSKKRVNNGNQVFISKCSRLNSMYGCVGLRITFDGISRRKSLRIVLRKTLVREARWMRSDSIFVHENGNKLGIQTSVHLCQGSVVCDDGSERRSKFLR